MARLSVIAAIAKRMLATGPDDVTNLRVVIPARTATDFEISVSHTFRTDPALEREWNNLVAHSDANHPFVLWGWLTAWYRSFGTRHQPIIVRARRSGRLVGAAAFAECDGVVELAGRGPSDYLEILLSNRLDAEAATACCDLILATVRGHVRAFRCFNLVQVRSDSITAKCLHGPSHGFLESTGPPQPAPCMDMSSVGKALRKQSLRRHERGLERLGSVSRFTFTRADDVLPQLDDFFELHRQRWARTRFPSLFHDARNREFYRTLTESLDSSGALRFSTVRLDDRLVAAHYGFYVGGRFVWYKPCFDPALARHSPGEVMIKYLLEFARSEGARIFDFTIGDEAFKMRFATTVRNVVTVYLTDSKARYLVKRMRRTVASCLRAMSQR